MRRPPPPAARRARAEPPVSPRLPAPAPTRPALAPAVRASVPPDVQFLASVLPPDTDPAFFEHLRALDCSDVTVRALPEGSLAFPNVPLLQVSGPLLVVQLLETPLLCLVSYARWGPRRSGVGAAGAGPGPWRGAPPR